MTAPQATMPFAVTRWTLVLQARGRTPEARLALSELCEAYYQPVFRFLRREGRGEDEARELAQEFFRRMLARGEIAADPARGRFRSYLLGAVKHFLADQRKHDRRARRGGGQVPVSLDAADPAEAQPPEVSAAPPSETWFDRQWALAVMERGLRAVEREWTDAGKSDRFEKLKPWLVGDGSGQSQAAAAGQLGWSETALKVAVHRLRRQFREAIRSEIRQTLGTSEDLEGELRYLVEVLSQESSEVVP
jgi:RNA polymerase sigma-70 factor (ECF subfamily)